MARDWISGCTTAGSAARGSVLAVCLIAWLLSYSGRSVQLTSDRRIDSNDGILRYVRESPRGSIPYDRVRENTYFGFTLYDGASHTMLGVPYWALTLGAVLLIVLYPIDLGVPWTGMARRAIGRHVRPGHCPKCGYNLTGNVSGICPECGRAARITTAVPRARSVRARPGPRRRP